ncbi:MAG: hypothetical protein COV52_04390 [Gammaproteobacteria bacterium CG11_big_fil_rev_8_21_14_0_20_46_22]|nr:MAG: hypothetical protein COV52_04390 [Gammaproteobacteria bacterium CG11_big_fil_rev_8_21_14_0_20_46_22]
MSLVKEDKKVVLIVGNIRRGEYERLVEEGYVLILLGDQSFFQESIQYKIFEAKYFHDLTKLNAEFISLIRGISEQYQIEYVLCLREYFIPAKVLINTVLSKKESSAFTYNLCLDKWSMKKVLASQLGQAFLTGFKVIRSKEDLEEVANNFRFPVILKPKALYGSLFVKKVMSVIELYSAYVDLRTTLIKYLDKKGIVSEEDKQILAEEYLSGSVHSIDGIVDGAGDVFQTPTVDVLTGKDLGFEDFGHRVRYAPSTLEVGVQENSKVLVDKAISALGLRKSAFHAEFIVTPDGPKLLEIAARPGGHRNYVIRTAYGIDLNLETLRMFEGKKPNVTPKYQRNFCIVSPYPSRVMKFSGLQGLEFIKQRVGFSQYQVKAKPGDLIGPANKGYMSAWNVELLGVDRDLMLNEAVKLAKFEGYYDENIISTPKSVS